MAGFSVLPQRSVSNAQLYRFYKRSRLILYKTKAMPIIDAAKKYVKVTAKKTEENRKTRGAYRSAVKRLETAIAASDTKNIDAYFTLAQKTLDKAVQKNVIKKNTAARKKSRLNKRIVAMKKK